MSYSPYLCILVASHLAPIWSPLMTESIWTPERALWFARGLFYVAAADGLNDDERDAIEAFARAVGLEEQLHELNIDEFDVTEASRRLGSSWLRRMFIFAARAMVVVDGQISPVEREAIRALAQGLSVPEKLALEGPPATPMRPEAMAQWIVDMPIDFVSWEVAPRSRFFWRFPHSHHRFSDEGQIHVGPGQHLLVSHQGAVVDHLEPGAYWLNPTQLPGLAAAAQWSQGTVSADFLFVRTHPSQRVRWGTDETIELAVSDEHTVPVRAFGRFSVRIDDPGAVAKRMASADAHADDGALTRLRRMVAGRFAVTLQAVEWDDMQALVVGLNDLDALVKRVFQPLRLGFQTLGLALLEFTIENLTGPDDLDLAPRSRVSNQMRQVGRQVLGVLPDEAEDADDVEPPNVVLKLGRKHAPTSGSSFVGPASSTDESTAASTTEDTSMADTLLESAPDFEHVPSAPVPAVVGVPPAPEAAVPPTAKPVPNEGRIAVPLPIGRPATPVSLRPVRQKGPSPASNAAPPSPWSSFDDSALEATAAPGELRERSLLRPDAAQEEPPAELGDPQPPPPVPSTVDTPTAMPVTPGVQSCVTCGSSIPNRGRFCPACGQEQPTP